MRRSGCWIAILALLLHHDAVPARGDEEPPPLDPVFRFSRARITVVNKEPFFGRTLTMQGDSLSYYRLGPSRSVGHEVKEPEERDLRRLALREVERVEIETGSQAGLGAGIGALVGVGTLLVVTAANEEWELEDEGLFFWGGLLIVIPGAVIGALIGSSIENWDTVYSPTDDR